MTIEVDARVQRRHPDVAPEDAEHAFAASLASVARTDVDPTQWLGVGPDGNGRLLEYVAIQTGADDWFIFHCMTATKKTMSELRLAPRSNRRGGSKPGDRRRRKP